MWSVVYCLPYDYVVPHCLLLLFFAELFMLQDKSQGQEETWKFLDRRLADVGEFGKMSSSVRALTFIAIDASLA